MSSSYDRTITPDTQKSAVEGLSVEQRASINPFALLGFGAALNLLEKGEEVADFTASSIAAALCVKFGAVVLRNQTESKKQVFGQFSNTPLKGELAEEIQSILSTSAEITHTIVPELGNEIEVSREALPKAASVGLRRILLTCLRTLDNDFGMILAGKSTDKPFTFVQRAALETLASQASFALHRIQLNNERAAKEALLRDSEKRYRSLYNHTPVMMHSIDGNGQLVSVNDYWLEVLGYERGEVIGRQSTDFLTEQSRRYFYEVTFPEFLKSGFAQEVEYQMVKKNGEVIDVLLSAIAEQGQKGEMSHSLAFIVDITKRKKAEKALRESEERFRKIFDHSNDLIFVIDPERDRILDANSQANRTLGYSRKELLSMSISAIHPNEMPKFLHFAQSVLEHGSGWTDELTCLTKSGSSLPAEISASLIDLDGKPYILALVRDITERKKAEQALRESEERLSRILESAMDAIITINQDKCIVLFNEAAEKVFRCPSAEAIGQPLDRYLSESLSNLITNYMKAFGKRKKSKQYMWAAEGLTARRADGGEFPIEATISQVEVSGQKLYTVILRDINERKKAEAELNKLQLQNIYLQEEIRTEYNFGEIVGASEAIKEVFQNIERVAATDSIVLLTGETGTGKELIAHAIHKSSKRQNNVLVKVNCSVLPSGLVESELFGHEKGAFTGATSRKKGRFELADGGTIFLDEIGELTLETQTKLLRVLQEQEFERVGGTQTIKVNVRVIAATNRNLEEAVKHGAFRADLFYRLNIFPLHVPALRERIDDIPLLTNYFVRRFARRMGKRIESINHEAMKQLMSYDWPGNVRELANVLERAVILCDGGVLKPEHIDISVKRSVTEEGIFTLEDAERHHILRALEKTGGVVGGPKGAANLLGINRSTLLSRMKKLGIEKNS
ncbi:MAG: sigma 54-interacting transcriptional regulator [bacterium]